MPVLGRYLRMMLRVTGEWEVGTPSGKIWNCLKGLKDGRPVTMLQPVAGTVLL